MAERENRPYKRRHECNAPKHVRGHLWQSDHQEQVVNFFSIEDWKINSPSSYTRTVPTALERGGDFSQSVDATGAQRLIYDPFIAPTVDPSTGNWCVLRLPATRSLRAASIRPRPSRSAFPYPNNAGQGPFHLNNFFKSLNQSTSYLNFFRSGRLRHHDKWRLSATMAAITPRTVRPIR